MGKRFLLDTNAAIYYLKSSLPDTGMSFLISLFSDEQVAISFISEIELFAFSNITSSEETAAKDLITWLTVLWVNDAIINQSINIRKRTKLKLPDAIIAATALVSNLELITSNIEDFKKVEGLKIINPLTV